MKELPDDEVLLTMQQTRQRLNVARSTIIRFVESGKLEGCKVGNTWRFRLSDVKKLIVKRSARGVGEDE